MRWMVGRWSLENEINLSNDFSFLFQIKEYPHSGICNYWSVEIIRVDKYYQAEWYPIKLYSRFQCSYMHEVLFNSVRMAESKL